LLLADSLTQTRTPGCRRLIYVQLAEQSHRGRSRRSNTSARSSAGPAEPAACLIASDECYLGLAWDAEPLSVLHPSVCDGDHNRPARHPPRCRRRRRWPATAARLSSPVTPRWSTSCWPCASMPGMIVPTPVQARDGGRASTTTRTSGSRRSATRAGASRWLRRGWRDAGFHGPITRRQASICGATRGEPGRDNRGLGWRNGESSSRPASFYGPRGRLLRAGSR